MPEIDVDVLRKFETVIVRVDKVPEIDNHFLAVNLVTARFGAKAPSIPWRFEGGTLVLGLNLHVGKQLCQQLSKHLRELENLIDQADKPSKLN